MIKFFLKQISPMFLMNLYKLLKRRYYIQKYIDNEEDITNLRQNFNLNLPNESVIIGNGPSFNMFIKKHKNFLEDKCVFCVNSFVVSNFFIDIKPKFYVFTDPSFWIKTDIDEVVECNNRIFENLKNKVSWDIILIFPIFAKEWNYFIELPSLNHHISIVYHTGKMDNSENRFELYKMNQAMPLCQTVTVSALFFSLNIGFEKHYIVGVDLSLHNSICVDKNNIVCFKEDHFYDQGKTKLTPLYRNPEVSDEIIKMDELFYRISLMFKGFMELEEYSKYLNTKIYNLSLESYVDAFERLNLDEIKV